MIYLQLSFFGCDKVDELILPHILEIRSALCTSSASALSKLNFQGTSVGISNLQTKIPGWKDGEAEINLHACPIFLNLGGTAGKISIFKLFFFRIRSHFLSIRLLFISRNFKV